MILGYFKRYSFKVRCQVKTVTVDMNASYASLVKKLFPNANLLLIVFTLSKCLIELLISNEYG
ncbi:hypothetical protein DB321_07570 [Ligilactobacillus salivarius]|uniref:Transposase IS204/IS1001/IS1096/IS1165 DDE domain-containing protein n=1 Tax=Ligilactobacillus salivarius TaxID=1624 RepID=A0ABD6XEV8_9LACO|nr:hypothetical protein CR249_09670 [Ligilactobacillus salivarius]ATP38325.1 hypothetical protein CR531_09190 [Ligilactobacillus salivarius]MBE7938389.1 transposase [Ligilactobacillus salivarius]NRD05350.1 transposase [Ligilactobacillus salivarius]OQQ95622.1 hypothetical protein B6U51_09420 [Ligilactobacillus salivarius]